MKKDFSESSQRGYLLGLGFVDGKTTRRPYHSTKIRIKTAAMMKNFSQYSLAALLVYCTAALGDTPQTVNREAPRAPVNNELTPSNAGQPVAQQNSLETYHLIQEILNDKLSASQQNIINLEEKIKAQEEKIRSLENKAIKSSSSDGEFSTTVVLAAVSVIVTVLGALIAVLSIFGYANIKKDATKISQETAQKTIDDIASKGLQEATEKSILILIEEGRFNKIIYDAIAAIEYRGISFDNDLLDDEENQK